MAMAKDYFVFRSDLNFIKEYDSILTDLRNYLISKNKNITEEEKTIRVRELCEYMKENSGRMSRLASYFRHIRRDAHEWARCACDQDDYNLYKRWISEIEIELIGRMNESKSEIFYQIIRRIFDIPFGVLNSVIGYDIRHQPIYKTWMTYIIVFGFGLYLASLANEIVEWGVDLYSKTRSG